MSQANLDKDHTKKLIENSGKITVV